MTDPEQLVQGTSAINPDPVVTQPPRAFFARCVRVRETEVEAL